MRKLIILGFVGLLFTSCHSSKYFMNEDEIAQKQYTIEGWNVLKAGKIVGTLTTMEWEIYKNDFVREISIKTTFSSDAEMKEIARFVHTKFPDCKIEVNEDGGNTFPKD